MAVDGLDAGVNSPERGGFSLLCVACIVAAACGGSGAPAGEPQAPIDLAGTRWRLMEADGRPVPPEQGFGPVTLEFSSDGRLGGFSGCNAYGAEYQIEGGRVVTSPIEANAQGCPDPVGSLETRLFEVLGDDFDHSVELDGALVVSDEGRGALRWEPVE